MAQLGDEGNMMLMCELVDKQDPILLVLAKEIATLHEQKVCPQNHGSETRVDATHAWGDSKTYINAMGISANFAGAKEALIACARPWRSSLVTDMRSNCETRAKANDMRHITKFVSMLQIQISLRHTWCLKSTKTTNQSMLIQK